MKKITTITILAILLMYLGMVLETILPIALGAGMIAYLFISNKEFRRMF